MHIHSDIKKARKPSDPHAILVPNQASKTCSTRITKAAAIRVNLQIPILQLFFPWNKPILENSYAGRRSVDSEASFPELLYGPTNTKNIHVSIPKNSVYFWTSNAIKWCIGSQCLWTFAKRMSVPIPKHYQRKSLGRQTLNIVRLKRDRWGPCELHP